MEKSNDMRERIEHILRAQNLTAAEFAEKLGIQASGMSHILSGRNNPSLDFVMKLKAAFPEYNLDWLLLGVGPMTSYEQPGISPRPVDDKLSLFSSQEDDENEKNKDATLSKQYSDDKPEVVSRQTYVPEEAECNLEMIVFVYSDGTFKQMLPRK